MPDYLYKDAKLLPPSHWEKLTHYELEAFFNAVLERMYTFTGPNVFRTVLERYIYVRFPNLDYQSQSWQD